MRKHVILFFAMASLCVMCVLSGCSSIKYRYNEGCWWDHETPTMKIRNDNGEDVYICESCASDCMYCDKTTYKFGFNLMGGPIPLCEEHYEN